MAPRGIVYTWYIFTARRVETNGGHLKVAKRKIVLVLGYQLILDASTAANMVPHYFQVYTVACPQTRECSKLKKTAVISTLIPSTG